MVSLFNGISTLCRLFNAKGRFCVLDVTIKDKVFRLIGIYGPCATSELPDFFQHINPFKTSSKQIILVVDWKAVLDPNLDRGKTNRATNNSDAKYFGEFVAKFDLINKFRERHTTKLELTWTSRNVSAQLYSYLYRVLG